MKSFLAGILLVLALLVPRPSLAAAASFVLLGPTSVVVGQEFQVTVQLRNATDVDTIRLLGSYSNDLLAWQAIQPSGAFKNVSPGNSVDEANGSFSFGAFTFEPYANGTVKTAVLTLKARQTGTATLRLLTGTEAYSAGEPTPVSLSTLRIRIVEAAPKPVPESIKDLGVTEPAKEKATIFSLSHPDSNSWYSDPNIIVSWSTEKPIASVVASFDQSPEANTYLAIPNEPTTFMATADGLWYVHLIIVYQDKTFGKMDMLFRYDGTDPRPIEPVVEQTDLPSTIPNRLVFGTVDETSGVDYYDLWIDGERVTSTRLMSYPLKDQAAGQHEVEVIAYDRAGNFTSGRTSYRVLASGEIRTEAPSFLSFFLSPAPLRRLGLLVLAILLGTSLWFIFIYRRRKKKKNR